MLNDVQIHFFFAGMGGGLLNKNGIYYDKRGLYDE